MTVIIRVDVEVMEPGDQDYNSPTGITGEAEDRLITALADAGFGIWDGPKSILGSV